MHALSGGRLTLGIGLGGRDDDYEVSGIETKGARQGPRRDAGADAGGLGRRRGRAGAGGRAAACSSAARVDASFERAARFGDGWIAGGSPPRPVRREAREKVEGGLVGGGPRGRAAADGASPTSRSATTPRRTPTAYLTDYYAWLGEEVAGYIAGSAAKDAETVQQYVSAFADAGCGELIFFPSSSDPAQVDLLADALGTVAASSSESRRWPTICRSSSSPPRPSSRPGWRRTTPRPRASG